MSSTELEFFSMDETPDILEQLLLDDLPRDGVNELLLDELHGQLLDALCISKPVLFWK